jgi:hypothetical protein
MRALLIAGILLAANGARADGCYLCEGRPGAYVRYQGDDTWDKRHKAEACGCKVGGTTSSCGAANSKILCSVAMLPQDPGARPAYSRTR